MSQDIYLKDHKDGDAIFVNEKTLNAYEDGPIIYFPNYTVVRSNANNQAFLLIDNIKRPLVDASAISALKNSAYSFATLEDIPMVANEKLEGYVLGNLISAQTPFPEGKLFKNETGSYFLVQDSMKYAVHPMVKELNYPGKDAEATTQTELEKYITGSPINLKDGSIVKNSQGDFYVISDGEKIKIKAMQALAQVFGELKYSSAVSVPDEIINLHESGLNIVYADDSIKDAEVAPNNPTTTYKAELRGVEPESITMFLGTSANIKIRVANTGTATWNNSNIWLQTQNSPAKYVFEESRVSPGETATFSLAIPSPQSLGLNPVGFSIYHNNNGSSENILSFGRFVIVQYGDTAKIVSQNIPVAVKNTWKPIKITVKIQNTSTSTPWLSRKTALEIYDANDKNSPFYDPNDWVRKEVVAVPQNKSVIRPGETGIFTFTLRVKGLKPGNYAMKFKLHLIDKKKEIILENSKEWLRSIRVDK